MAARARACLLAAAAISLLFAVASAQSGSGSSDCTSALVSLSPCMDYISGNGTAKPSASCCSQLRIVVQSKPECLCAALGSDASSSLGGVTIDRERALGLPAACNVQTPPVSQCGSSGSSGGGSKTTPKASFGYAIPGPERGLFRPDQSGHVWSRAGHGRAVRFCLAGMKHGTERPFHPSIRPERGRPLYPLERISARGDDVVARGDGAAAQPDHDNAAARPGHDDGDAVVLHPVSSSSVLLVGRLSNA